MRAIRVALVPIPVEGPMDRVAVDILGPPMTENGNTLQSSQTTLQNMQ